MGLQVRVGLNTGPVVVGEMGSDLRMEYTAMGDAGKIQVKGREEPVRTRGIEGLHSPMVGRDKEQALLMEAVENLVSGKGQIVTVMGETSNPTVRRAPTMILLWASAAY